MNYERALKTLNHARTGKTLYKKKLENETWLERVTQLDEAEYLVDLVLFNKHILTWYPDGSIALDNKGFWRRTTLDRFNNYLPSGFRVWQCSPYWYLKTPRGVLPYRNEITLTADGNDPGLPRTMTCLNAFKLKDEVRKYCQFYANQLVSGRISEQVGCAGCVDRELSRIGEQEHLLAHVRDKTTPSCIIMRAADTAEIGSGTLGKSILHEVLKASWKENQVIWRRPRSKKAVVARTEALMTSDDLPNLSFGLPREHIVNLWLCLEYYILTMFRFERMQE
jgi:hypothetical protein